MTRKAARSKFVHKANNSETATTSGYPLFLFNSGGQNNIFFHPPELSLDHKTYWTFTMVRHLAFCFAQLTRGVWGGPAPP